MLNIMFSWKVAISYERECCTENHHGCDAVISTRLGAKAFIPQSCKLYFGPVESNNEEITICLFVVCLINHLFTSANTDRSANGPN